MKGCYGGSTHYTVTLTHFGADSPRFLEEPLSKVTPKFGCLTVGMGPYSPTLVSFVLGVKSVNENFWVASWKLFPLKESSDKQEFNLPEQRQKCIQTSHRCNWSVLCQEEDFEIFRSWKCILYSVFDNLFWYYIYIQPKKLKYYYIKPLFDASYFL